MNKKFYTALIAASAAAVLPLQAQRVVSGAISSNDVWGDDANEDFIVLDGTVFVNNGATLEIRPGTIVRGQPRFEAGESGAPGSLVVTQEGRIEANGNASSPIIFTTAAVDNDGDGIPDDDDSNGFMDQWQSGDSFYDADPLNSPLGILANGPIPGATGTDPAANVQLWGGLIVLGSAPTNLGTSGNATAKVGNVEGLPANNDTDYGGTVANDDSGVLRFLSVRHGGEVLGSANEINGITLAGVGFGTTVEFCEVYMNWDDGFEWFGGTVNGNNLVATYVGDDSFDGDQGYIGQLQYLFAIQSYFANGSSGGDEAFEFDGTDGDQNTDLNGDPSPFPGYAVANFTVVGPTGATGYDNTIDANGRLLLRNEFSGDLYNGYIVGATGDVLSIPTPNPVTLDTLTTTGSFGADANKANVTSANLVDGAAGAAGLVGEDQAVQGGLNPRPVVGFNAPGISSSLDLGNQFEDTSFVGAFNTSANETLWTTGWAVLNVRGILVD